MIHPLFYVPICKLSINDWQDKKSQILLVLENNDKSVKYIDNIHTDYYVQENKGYIDYRTAITLILKEELQIACNELNLSRIEINRCWFERAKKYDYHKVHNHGSIGYSGVVYVEYDNSKHTSTTFVSPFNNFITGETIINESKVKEGDMLIFPSILSHYTEPNKSDVDRVILSFNLEVAS